MGLRIVEQVNRASKVRPPNVTGGMRHIIGEQRLGAHADVREAWQRLCKRDNKAQIAGHFLPFHPRPGASPSLPVTRPRLAVGQLEKLSEALAALPNPQQMKPVMLAGGGRYELAPTADSLQQDYAIISLTKRIAETGDVAVQRVPFRMWPRDYFTDFFGAYFWNVEGASLNTLTDGAGSGGAVIAGERRSLVLVSESLDEIDRQKLRIAYEPKVRVYDMPGGYVLNHDGTYKQTSHLDYSIGLLEEQGILLVDEIYWLNHEREVVRFLDAERLAGHVLDPIIVDDAEKQYYPTNLIEFQNGNILINYCPETVAKIRKKISGVGIDMVQDPGMLESLLRSNGEDYDQGGGIRCVTNRYYPIADYLMCLGLPEESIRSFLAWFNSRRASEYAELMESGWNSRHEESLRDHFFG